ncbi:MAG: ATP-binding protein [Gallionella sp.]|nr:ATP-binding protein [Gallionella sp.]
MEFKTSFDKTTVESLVAFANTQGGTVLVGVSDAGLIHGVTLGKETLNEWGMKNSRSDSFVSSPACGRGLRRGKRAWLASLSRPLGQIKSATSPSLIPDMAAENFNGKTVAVIQVSEFPVKPVSTRGRYFKRVASSNHQLGSAEIADLYMQSLQISWDAHQAGTHTIDDLSMPKIKRFIQQVNDNGRFALEGADLAALEKLNYIVNGRPTWAAMLLFAQEPIRHHIHIGRFKTPSMIIDDRQFTDTLFEVVEQSMKFIISYISVAFEFDGSIQRKERFAYPLPALREALLNAVIHRNYTDGSDIQIKIFDDKISIFSPGLLYGGLKLDELSTDNYKSRLRNKLVAEAFYLTGNIEKYGSGFIRIRKALHEYPEVSFKAKEISGGIELAFTQEPQPQPESRPESRPESQPESQPLAQRVLNILTDGAIGKQEISTKLGQPMVSGQLNKIVRDLLQDGLIELTLPEKPNSRLQKYKITPTGLAQLLNQKEK